MTTPIPPALAVGDDVTAAWLDLVAAWIASAGQWQAYTPALTGSVTNPTLGAGAQRVGRFAQIGKLVACDGVIVFGTSGTNAGSGTYGLSMPVAPANSLISAGVNNEIGQATLQCGGGSLRTGAVLTATSGGTVSMSYIDAVVNGGTHSIGAAVPGAWTAGDFIRFHALYEAA